MTDPIKAQLDEISTLLAENEKLYSEFEVKRIANAKKDADEMLAQQQHENRMYAKQNSGWNKFLLWVSAFILVWIGTDLISGRNND
jgi:hypothetical protein